MYNVYVPF